MKTLKNKIFAGVLALASLGIFGARNESKAQECQTYNHDEDEFSEEMISWKREGFNEANLKPNLDEVGFTIIYYSDKDGDNFHENIKVFNYVDKYSDSNSGYFITEEFNIEKRTGLIDHNVKSLYPTFGVFNRDYAHEDFSGMVKKELLYAAQVSHPYLTQQDLYNMGLGSRIKKLIEVGENQDKSEIKRLVDVERNYFKTNLE